MQNHILNYYQTPKLHLRGEAHNCSIKHETVPLIRLSGHKLIRGLNASLLEDPSPHCWVLFQMALPEALQEESHFPLTLGQGTHCWPRDWCSCWDTSFRDFLLEWFVTPFPIFSLLWLNCVVTWWCAISWVTCEVSVGCILCASNPVIVTWPYCCALNKQVCTKNSGKSEERDLGW